MKSKIVMLITAGLLTASSFGQTSKNKWAVDLQIGVEEYKGELGSGFYKFGQDLNGFVGASVSRYLSPRFDVGAQITYGDMSYDNGKDAVVFFRQNMLQANLFGRFNILTEEYKWRPYLFAGFGHMQFADGDYKQANTIIPYGLGLTYQVRPNIALRLQETFIYSDFDRMDKDPSKDLNDSYLQHTLTLSFSFGNKNDADKDGFDDDEDECPNVIGTVKGCPDSDGDGIADKDDKCPDLAGVAANNGCPEIKAEDVKVLNEALHGINFASGKAVISESSYGILDKVVLIMKNNPSYKLKIEGHTDSQGNDELNLNLSEKRVQAVKTYLVEHGVEASRLSAKGFGETKPIADNGTAEGRAENRRVELKIVF